MTSDHSEQDPSPAVHRRIAELALDYVCEPPGGDDPVITFADPEELHSLFAAGIGLDFGETVPAADEDALVAAAELVLEYSMHTTHPRFLNQNFAGPDPIAVVGDWLAAALNTTNATFEVAPVFTLMERAVIAKLAFVAGFRTTPEPVGSPPGMFCPGGSTATLYALQLARHRHDPTLIQTGANSDRLVLFVSKGAHYAALKSAALLGLGMNAVIEVETTDDGAMVTSGLRDALAQAKDAGQTPFAVVATAGTTVTSAFDPIDEIADVCQEQNLWLHVDGCWGGSALFSPSEAPLMNGIDRADSFVWNLHKMMGMTQQCSVLLLQDPEQLAPVFSSNADYIFQPDKQYGEYDAGDRTFQCGRRVDVLKLWLAWKLNGDDGFRDRVDHAVALARHTRTEIAESDGRFAAIVEGTFTNVCFTWVPPEFRPLDVSKLTETERARLHQLAPRIKARMQREGTAMVGYQPVLGLNVFRLLFMNRRVKREDVNVVLELIATYGADEWSGLTG